MQLVIRIDIHTEDLREWLELKDTRTGVDRFRKHLEDALHTHVEYELSNIPREIFEDVRDSIKIILEREEEHRGTRFMPDNYRVKKSEPYHNALKSVRENYPSDEFSITTDWTHQDETYRVVEVRVWSKAGDYRFPLATYRFKFQTVNDVIVMIP